MLGKYDLVFSFSGKDKLIANRLKKSFKKKCFKIYIYLDEDNEGKDLDTLTDLVFGEKANNALVILSKNYLSNSLTMKELRLLQRAKKEGKVKQIFYIKLNSTLSIPGIYGSNEIYMVWSEIRYMDIVRKISKNVKRNSIVPPCFRDYGFYIIIILLTIITVAAGMMVKAG